MTELLDDILKAEALMFENYLKVQELREKVQAERVECYEFKTSNDTLIQLGEMLADHELLVVIHNMGSDCYGCSLWAEGISKAYAKISELPLAVYIASPDSPERLAEVMRERNWKTPMVSVESNSFAKDMGFQSEDGEFEPGVSIFKRIDGNQIFRIQTATLYFG